MLRQLLPALLGFVCSANVSGQNVDLKAVCDAEDCAGQDLIEKFAGINKLIFLSGDSSCHIVDIQVKPKLNLLYEIFGDKNYTVRFEKGCFRPVHSTVLKELFVPIKSCPDILINIECKRSAQDVFLISKQNPGDCLAAGLGEVEKMFQYRVEIETLDRCGEQKKGIWHSVVGWFKGAWRTVKGWF